MTIGTEMVQLPTTDPGSRELKVASSTLLRVGAMPQNTPHPALPALAMEPSAVQRGEKVKSPGESPFSRHARSSRTRAELDDDEEWEPGLPKMV